MWNGRSKDVLLQTEKVGPLGDKVVGVVTYDGCLVRSLTCFETSPEQEQSLVNVASNRGPEVD